MVRSRLLRCLPLVVLILLTPRSTPRGEACTTAVISGRATADGRPLLWKNRDTSNQHNELVIFDDGKYRVLAVVNAGRRGSVWMGVNEAGFCIENSVSRDLRTEEKSSGPGNGGLMKLALQTCATVADFRRLLEETNLSGRTTVANFGVIDAHGGAALFETGPKTFAMFDANDPEVAPHGYIVRANFATTAHNLPATPDPGQVPGDIYSAKRFMQACRRLEPRHGEGITLAYVVRHMTRDLSDEQGIPYPGSVNGEAGDLPEVILTDRTISRTTTVSAAVFQGVKPGEHPALATMWTLLGDPKFSIAVPCWAGVTEVADSLAGEHGGELGEIAITLRGWSLNETRDGLRTAGLPGLWQNVWPVEDRIFSTIDSALAGWRDKGVSPAEMTRLHAETAALAKQVMRKELREMKQAALELSAPPPPEFSTIRVAIYDHSEGTAKGPNNLLRFLTSEAGFACRRVTPDDIREGALRDSDVLIMPGGSGSLQAKKLEAAGRDEIRRFVKEGGGYVGICAGSYLASSHYDWSLGLINARVWDRVHWARGQGNVTLGLTAPGRELLHAAGDQVEVYYGQGPLLVPDNNPDLPGYQVLARYETEVARKGAPEEAMTGTHAIIRSKFGAGRVICFSPHPEANGGPNLLMLSGVRWAGTRRSRFADE
jgi:glutamine amidotransferase-like uncharacterized protein